MFNQGGIVIGLTGYKSIMNKSLSVNCTRLIIAGFCLGILSFIIISVFWYYDYQYSLPTPKPYKYQNVATGTVVNLPEGVKSNRSKPLLLHFFNPDCPCSRFNISHFKSLIKQYKNEVDFAIVLMTNKQYKAKQIQEKFDLDIPVITDKSLAIICGVYSTPQAALLDRDNRLYFRGNYNQSRYCSDKRTEYARIAIQSLLYSKNVLNINPLAMRAYGCRLPDCTN